ncbi:MAG: hypothetical protein ACR2MP_33695 [Streptosporangiaceae bacterium]
MSVIGLGGSLRAASTSRSAVQAALTGSARRRAIAAPWGTPGR